MGGYEFPNQRNLTTVTIGPILKFWMFKTALFVYVLILVLRCDVSSSMMGGECDMGAVVIFV